MQLFISWNNNKVESAVVTEIARYPNSKVLRYFLAGGTNLENWLERIQIVIEKFAKNKIVLILKSLVEKDGLEN